MHRRIFYVTMILVLAALACNFPGSATPVPTGLDRFPTSTLSPVVESSATEPPLPGTQEPAANPTAALIRLVELNYKGLRFEYPVDLFTGFDGQVLPAEIGEAGTAGWPGSVPESIQVNVTGYPLKDTLHEPRLTVYPIQVYEKINSAAGDIADRLESFLAQNDFEAKNLPFLPMFNAGQAVVARAGKFPFQNGNGLRYLTCYAQAFLPIDSNCLFYTYQGLTSDQINYLTVIFPVSLAALDTPEMKKMYEDATLNYDEVKLAAYMQQVEDVINQADPSEFTPNLDSLDRLLSSVNVEPEVELKGPGVNGVYCPNAIAQRLQPDMRARVTFTDGTPLRVRQSPGKSGSFLGQIPEGTTMVVTGGPECADDGLWWQVNVDGEGGLQGWVLEGEGGNYFIEPLK